MKSATDKEIRQAALDTIRSTEDCCRGIERERLEDLLMSRTTNRWRWKHLVGWLLSENPDDEKMIESFNAEIIFDSS